MVLAGCSLFGWGQNAIVCDGVWPQWMLDAADYNGGGCVEVLPPEAAPPNADWTPVCTGNCLCPEGELPDADNVCRPPPPGPWPYDDFRWP